MGSLGPHRGISTPHDDPRTLLFPDRRIPRHQAGRTNKFNYIACFHIYIISYFFTFVKSKECKGPWSESLSSPRLPLASLLSTPASPSQVSPHQMGTRFMVDIEPEPYVEVLQGPTLIILVHTSGLVHLLLSVVRHHKEYGCQPQTQ